VQKQKGGFKTIVYLCVVNMLQIALITLTVLIGLNQLGLMLGYMRLVSKGAIRNSSEARLSFKYLKVWIADPQLVTYQKDFRRIKTMLRLQIIFFCFFMLLAVISWIS
jgi:hypothetical protein